jgi:outer membrane protein
LQQLFFTQKKVEQGALPALSLAQLQAQVAGDSATLLNSIVDENTALLDLKAFLNIDMATAFDIVVPNIAELNFYLQNYPTPEEIFAIAKTKRPAIVANNLKIQSAAKQIDIAKANGKPKISAGFNLGTNYASTVKKITGLQYLGDQQVGTIKIADSTFPVFQPQYQYLTSAVSLFQQYNNNFRNTLNAGLSIPILNGYATKLSVARAQLNKQNTELVQDVEINTLKQNVYKAYNDAQNAIQKFKAAQSSQSSSQTAVEYAVKRYNAGMLSTQEYTVQQNNLARAKINTTLIKYDLVFKMKILDFYCGKSITL